MPPSPDPSAPRPAPECGVEVAWTPLPGAAAFVVEVLDADGRPVPVEYRDGAAVVDPSALAPGGALRVRVRAVPAALEANPPAEAAPADAPAAPRAEAPADVPAEERPGDEALAALHARLAAAGADFALSPEVLGTPSVTRALSRLLGVGGAGLPLRGVALSADGEAVAVEAGTTLFGRDVRASLRFTADGEDGVRLALSAALGDWDLGGLYDAGVLREPPAGAAAWRALGVPSLDLWLDSAAGQATLSGDPSPAPWGEVAGIAGTLLGPAAAGLRVRLREDGLRDWEPGVLTTLALRGGPALPVRLTVPHGLGGWRIALASPVPVALAGVSALAPLLAGTEEEVLPEALRTAEGLALEWLDAGASPARPDCWDAWLGLAWPALPATDGLPPLRRPSATLHVRHRTVDGQARVMASGALRGWVEHEGAPVEVTAELPAGPDGPRFFPALPPLSAPEEDSPPAEAAPWTGDGEPEEAAPEEAPAEVEAGSETPSSAEVPPGPPAPAGIAVRFLEAERRVEAEWEAVPGAEVYQAQLTDGAGEPLEAPGAVATFATRLVLDASALPDGVPHGLRVRTVADEEAGPWSPPVPFTPGAAADAETGEADAEAEDETETEAVEAVG